jgi:hypothetical protein
MGAVAESCCSNAASETVTCESPSDQADPCGCDLVPRDEQPAVPVRTQPDVRVSVAVFTHGLQTTAIDVGQLCRQGNSTALPVHARPLRVLYGVWRN